MAHLIRTRLAPPHAAPLHPLANDRLARRLTRARPDRPPLGHVGRIVHPMYLVLEVAHYLAVYPPHRLAAVRLHPAQRREHRTAPLVLQPVAPPLIPALARRLVGRIKGPAQVSEVLRRVVEV